jgi:hypothetical protein
MSENDNPSSLAVIKQSDRLLIPRQKGVITPPSGLTLLFFATILSPLQFKPLTDNKHGKR